MAILYAASATESFTGGLGTAAFLAFLMAIVEKERAATEYALLSSVFALSRSVAGWVGGLGAQSMGYGNWFLLTFFLAAPAYLLLPWVSRMLRGSDSALPERSDPADRGSAGSRHVPRNRRYARWARKVAFAAQVPVAERFLRPVWLSCALALRVRLPHGFDAGASPPLNPHKYVAIAHRDHDYCNPVSATKFERILDLMPLDACSRVLDLGCGRAELSLRIIERYGSTVIAWIARRTCSTRRGSGRSGPGRSDAAPRRPRYPRVPCRPGDVPPDGDARRQRDRRRRGRHLPEAARLDRRAGIARRAGLLEAEAVGRLLAVLGGRQPEPRSPGNVHAGSRRG